MTEQGKTAQVRIEPWGEDDLELLRRINSPEMKEHLGGPETDEQVLARHNRYVALEGAGQMFTIVLLPGGDKAGDKAGSIGYWEREWQGETVYESGWGVLPQYQGRGIAVAATLAVAQVARARRTHRYLHAYPSVGNPASNAICRKAGFELMGECDFEFPPGHMMRCHDWRLDLFRVSPSIS